MAKFMKISVFMIFTFLVQSVFAQTVNIVPDYIRVAVEKELISSYSYRWADKQLVMTKENILTMQFSPERIQSCDFAITGFANKPMYEGCATYQYLVCVAVDRQGLFKAALINDNLIAEE